MFNMLPDFTLTKVQKNNLYTYRLWRLRQAMKKADVGLCILNNPISLRYVIDFDEYQLFQSLIHRLLIKVWSSKQADTHTK